MLFIYLYISLLFIYLYISLLFIIYIRMYILQKKDKPHTAVQSIGPQTKSKWDCPTMMKNPSMNLWGVWILIIPQVIWIHIREWEVVCRLRRGMRMIQISYLKFGEVVVVRRGVNIVNIDILATTTMDLFQSVRLCLWLPVREEIHTAVLRPMTYAWGLLGHS